jgi:hypothetical protein
MNNNNNNNNNSLSISHKQDPQVQLHLQVYYPLSWNTRAQKKYKSPPYNHFFFKFKFFILGYIYISFFSKKNWERFGIFFSVNLTKIFFFGGK